MTSKRVRNLFKFAGSRTKSQSTTDLAEWSKSDEKLMKAVEAGDVKKVSSILSKKAMVPSKLGPRGQSIFHVACALGNQQIVELLLKETDDVNDLTIQGNTCLQLAAARGHDRVVRRLIQSAAEVDLRDKNDMTALHHACAGQHYSCVEALLEGGADPCCMEKGGKTPLFYAAHRGDISICKLLVDKGADINAGDKMQITPLMVAAKEGNKDACEFLLKRGANPSTADRDGHQALYYAMAAGHPELREVFANAPQHASWSVGNASDGAASNTDSSTDQASLPVQVDMVSAFTQDASPVPQRPADAVQSLAGSDAESMNQSEDESPPQRRASDSNMLSPGQAAAFSKDAKAYKELADEHEQLNEEYHKLSIENLRLRDKVDFLEQKMNAKHEQGVKPAQKDLQGEIRNLKNLLEEEKERSKELEARLADNTQSSGKEPPDTDSWHDSDEELFDGEGKKSKSERGMNDKQMVAMLRSQIFTLRQENDQLKEKLQQALPNGYRESSPYRLSAEGGDVNANDATDVQQRISVLEAEKQELKAELLKLKESSAAEQLSGALGQEELIHSKKQLEAELSSLKTKVTTLTEEKADLESKVAALEEEKAALPSDKLAVMNSARLMEEVKFDEEGFVDGQDLTKEEFLQAQNEQLKVQCGLLTEELSKLRGTFDAILKAGDNLQADYDQLQAEKDKLHDQLEALVREKEEVVKENEFLLSDGNALHEDLKKLVHELEKMQEKYKKVCAEKEALQHQATAVNIAGKVGEVARLLEERDKLQQRLAEAEETAERLTHDQAILLEEVQSLQEGNAALTKERDALQAELEDAEALVTQNEALTQDYAQLELDFNDLLKEKEQLEQDLAALSADPNTSAGARGANLAKLSALEEERNTLMAERDQLELTIKELSRENAVLEERLEVAGKGQGKGQGEGKETVRHLERRVEELTRENGELEEELANLQEHVAVLEAQGASKTATWDEEGDDDKEALKASVSQLEITVTELSRENAQLEEELVGVREQLDRAQDALERRAVTPTDVSVSTANTLSAERQQLADRVAELEAKLDAVQAGTDSTRQSEDTERLADTVTKLEAENKQLETELRAVKTQLANLAGDSKGTSVSRTVVNGLEASGSTTDSEVQTLRAEVKQLSRKLAELKKTHRDTVNIYRTHLLSAVQGHMDPEVKEALHSIIEMRSMEQFC